MRAEAAWKRDHWGPKSTYLAERMAAVVDTCDWLEGRRELAPATGERRAADGDGVSAELSAARGMDERAWMAGRGAAATRPQAVAETLAWFFCDPTADNPA